MSGITDIKDRVRAAEARLREAVEARERGNSELNQMWEQVRDRFVAKDGELAGFRDRIGLREGELFQIREQLVQQEAQIEALRDQLAKKEVEINGQRERAAQQDAEIKALHGRVADRDSEIGALQSRIAKQSKEIAGHEAHVATLKEQNSELSESIEALLASVEGRISALGASTISGLGDQMKGLVEAPLTPPDVAIDDGVHTGAPPAPQASEPSSNAMGLASAEGAEAPAVPAAEEVGPIDEPPAFGISEDDAVPHVSPESESEGSLTTPDDPTQELSVSDIVATVQASQENVADMGTLLQNALTRLGVEEKDSQAMAESVEFVPPPPPPPPPEPAPAPLEFHDEETETGLRKLMSRLGPSARSDAAKKVKKRLIGRPKRKREEDDEDPAEAAMPIVDVPDMSAAEEVAMELAEAPAPIDSPADETAPDPAAFETGPNIDSEPESLLHEFPEVEDDEAVLAEGDVEAALTEPNTSILSLGESDEAQMFDSGDGSLPTTDPELAEELEEIESLRTGLTGLRDRFTE